MVHSVKLLLPLAIALSLTLSSRGEERDANGNVSLGAILNLLNETKWILAQRSQDETAELRERVSQLWQERQEERQRKLDEEDDDSQQILEELRRLKEDGRESRNQLQLQSALDIFLNLQGRVIEMQREMHDLEVHQLQQLAALNSSTARMVKQQQLDLIALNRNGAKSVDPQFTLDSSSAVQGRVSEVVQPTEINEVQDSLAAMNDSFFIQLSENQMMQQKEFQQLQESLESINCSFTRPVNEEVRQTDMDQLQEFLIAMNGSLSQIAESQVTRQQEVQKLQASMTAIKSSVDSADQVQEMLLRCRNENEAANDALTAETLLLDRNLNNINSTMTQVIQNDTVPSSCNNTKVLHGTQGSLAVSESEYINNMNCGWRLVTPPGSVVVLKWRKLNTEYCCDKVTVSDATGTLIARLSGGLTLAHMVVLTNEVQVTFITDGSATRTGFQLDYQALQTS